MWPVIDVDPELIAPDELADGSIAFLASLDLGKTSDHTALSFTEIAQRESDGQREYLLRHLERWPLGTKYETIVADTCALLIRPPVYGRCALILDATGVGNAVRELFEPDRTDTDIATLESLPESGFTRLLTTPDGIQRVFRVLRGGGEAARDLVRPHVSERAVLPTLRLLQRWFAFRGLREIYPVVITNGREYRVDDESNTYYVPKRDVVAATQIVLQERRVRFPASLPLVSTLQGELGGFRARPTAAGNEVFEAREGEHDDLVLSLALGIWVGEMMDEWDPGSA